MRIALWLLFVHAAGCGGQLAEGADDSAGGGLDAGGTSGTCLSSSECPTGFICNEFGRCEMPAPPPTGDGGTEPPPETEIEIGPPVSSQSFVYVAMTSQDELARIDEAAPAGFAAGERYPDMSSIDR